MNDSIFVQFVVDVKDADILTTKLAALGNDFSAIQGPVWSINSAWARQYFSVAGKINSSCASVIKLSDPFLAEHMRISYISDELKDKYRVDK